MSCPSTKFVNPLPSPHYEHGSYFFGLFLYKNRSDDKITIFICCVSSLVWVKPLNTLTPPPPPTHHLPFLYN